MEDLLSSGFAIEDNAEFTFSPSVVVLKGPILCVDSIVLEVDKAIHVLSGRGPSAIVQTHKFTYHARIRAEYNLLRYDSAHRHRPYAHKHIFDPFDRGREIQIIELRTEEEIPSLRQVVDELRAWYEENGDRLRAHIQNVR